MKNNIFVSTTFLDNESSIYDALLFLDKNGIKSRIDDVLKSVSLDTKGFKMPFELSGGEQQRVAVARALVMRPSLLLADEPTGDLDEQSAGTLHRLLRDMHSQYKLTSIIATHNLSLARACDRVLRLEEGRLRAS